VQYDAMAAFLDPLSDSLPKLDQSRHSHYSQWYTPKTRQLIAERFVKDIALFGYEFEQR